MWFSAHPPLNVLKVDENQHSYNVFEKNASLCFTRDIICDMFPEKKKEVFLDY